MNNIIFRQNQRWKTCYEVPEREELQLTNCGYSCNGESSIQFSSVAQSCPTLCHPMDCSTLGPPIHHQLPEFTQTHLYWVGDAIQPSPAFHLSQHQGLFHWISSSHEAAKVLEFQLQHQSFQSLRMVTAAMKLKDAYSLEGKSWPT